MFISYSTYGLRPPPIWTRYYLVWCALIMFVSPPTPRFRPVGYFSVYSRHCLPFAALLGMPYSQVYITFSLLVPNRVSTRRCPIWKTVNHAFLNRPRRQAVPSQAPSVRAPSFEDRETYFLRQITLNHCPHVRISRQGCIERYETRLGNLWVASFDFLNAFLPQLTDIRRYISLCCGM